MKSPLAARDRDRLIEAILPDVAFDGWSHAALRVAARQLGIAVEEARALFPRGAPDLVAGFSRWADRRMLDRFEAAPPEAPGTASRIKRALALRFEVVAPWREAVRRALSVLALPPHVVLGSRLLYETVDGIWYAAGDTATDFSFFLAIPTLVAAGGYSLWKERALLSTADVPLGQNYSAALMDPADLAMSTTLSENLSLGE